MCPAPPARFEALRQQALADGLMDAALLQVYEGRWRPEERRDQRWLDHQGEKVERALRYAEKNMSTPPWAFHVGHVALACALGYLDLRFGGRWRDGHPKLAAWLEDFEKRVPAFAKTRVAP
jgi:glutathione S-transferase